MSVHVCYDVTRLLTRLLTATPNGIDRIDAALAAGVLDGTAAGGLVATPAGPRLLTRTAARAAVRAVAAHWGEDGEPAADDAYPTLVAWLSAPPGDAGPRRIVAGRRGRARIAVDWLRAYGLPRGRPARDLPAGARYLNASQFPLWMTAPFRWLDARPDVKAVFFVHDTLPLEMPERFRAGEAARHRRRLDTLARYGAGAIVASEPVRAALARQLAARGRTLPILVAPPPAASVFTQPRPPDARLAPHSYFVCCGTFEPRKNHLLLLECWQALVAERGRDAPRLVLVGARGWAYAPVIELLARRPALRSHAIEVSGLTSPALRALLDSARGLLMPTWAEGFGLPVHEALAAGCPVIAADIPVFAAIADPLLTRLDPADAAAWRAAIGAAADAPRAGRSPQGAGADTAHVARIESFMAAL